MNKTHLIDIDCSEMPLMMSKELITIEEVKQVVSEGGFVLLYFYNNNCAPCHSIRSKMEQLVDKEFAKIKMYYIDGIKSGEIAGFFSAFSSPVMILFVDGKETKRYGRYTSIQEIRNGISRLFDIY